MKDSKLNTGLTSWQRSSNHNRMMEFQQTVCDTQPKEAQSTMPPKLAYFGGSAFQLTTPAGITIMIDPWRNHPSRKWDWYFNDFPETTVDIGVSTHAHFDHDALHRLDAHVLLDRLIGRYEFSDVTIEGLADKHATDSSAALYDFKNIIREFDGIDITPPNNPRSWDNCLVTMETGGMRILHWGDNRNNPPESVWNNLGRVDVLLIPVDNSQHVLSNQSVNEIIDKLAPSIVVPHHYYIWDLVQRQSTLQPASDWLKEHSQRVIDSDGAEIKLDVDLLAELKEQNEWKIINFANHVMFDTENWRKTGA